MTVSVLATSKFRQVEGYDDPDRTDFAKLYAAVASPKALVWAYTGDDVDGVLWRDNAPHFIQTARTEDGRMAGLVCAHPLSSSAEPKVHEWIGWHVLPLPMTKDNTAVISCVAIRPDVRKRGLGMSLGYAALRWARERGFEHFVLQAESDAARHPDSIGYRLGAREVARLKDGSEDREHILLLYGHLADALSGDESSH